MAANPLKVLVELQAKQGAVVSGSAGLSVEHDAAIAGALSVVGASTLTGNVEAQGMLDVTGQATFADAIAAENGMTVTGAPIDASAVAVSASALSVANDVYVGGKITVQGNLEVLGQLDAISRTDLQVTDVLIVAAKGAATAAAADEGGFKLEGANAEIKYAALDDSWNMNKKLNLAHDLAVAGDSAITGDESIAGELSVTGAASMSSTLGVSGKITGNDDLQIDGAANFDGAVTATAGLDVQAAATIAGGLTLSDTGLTISGGGATITGGVSATSDISAGGHLEVTDYAEIGGYLDVAGTSSLTGNVSMAGELSVTGAASMASSLDVTGAATLSDTLSVAEDATFSSNAIVDGIAKVAASGSLSVIGAAETDAGAYYDVAKAIKLLDSNVGDNKTAVINAYNAVRIKKVGAFAAGQAIVNLSSENELFDSASKDYVALDVMVKDGVSGEWQNDLVAVHLFVDGSDLKLQIDALTEASDYRLIAVNEKEGKFSW